MDIMPHRIKDPERVSAVTALLDQIPADLRAQLEAAFADDLSFMFNAGMDAGKQLTIDVIQKGRRAVQATKPAVPSRPTFRVLLGGAL